MKVGDKVRVLPGYWKECHVGTIVSVTNNWARVDFDYFRTWYELSALEVLPCQQ